MKSDAFKKAAEAKDFGAADDLFADDVTFRSPFVHTPYEGLDAIKFILGNVVQVFEDFSYTGHTETDDLAVLEFKANVGDKQLQGVDILRFDSDGKISDMTVMVRPMSGLQALSGEMAKRMEATGVTPG